MSDNWYIVLELDITKEAQNMSTIEKKLDEKLRFWATNYNHPIKGAQYRIYYQQKEKIILDLQDENIRKKMREEAQQAVFMPIDKTIRIIGRNRNITSGEIAKIAKKNNAKSELIESRAVSLGYTVEDKKEINYRFFYDEYYKSKIENEHIYINLPPLLKAFKKSNLYDFLFEAIDFNDNKNLDSSDITDAISRRRNEFFKNDAISDIGKKLCTESENILGKYENRMPYYEYLEKSQVKNILEEVKLISSIYEFNELPKEQIPIYIKELSLILKDEKLAKDILISFCKIEGIIYTQVEDNKKNKIENKICRCGYTNNIAGGRKICANCGQNLYMKCPNCQKEVEPDIIFCTCGYSMRRIDRFVLDCKLADNALDNYDLKLAGLHIEFTKQDFSSDERVIILTKRFELYKEIMLDQINEIQEKINEKFFVKAFELYEGMKKRFLNYRNYIFEKKINMPLELATDMVENAKKEISEENKINMLANAYEICCDYPEIFDLLKKYPQKDVGFIHVKEDFENHENVILWEQIESKFSILYTLIRKENSPANFNGDGEILIKTPNNTFVDKNIIAGKSYFYTIFVDRLGVLSKGKKTKKPAINLQEIQNLNINAKNNALAITWAKVSNFAKVVVVEHQSNKEIYRGKEIGCLISHLNNNQKYKYHVYLEYNINGDILRTKGIAIEAIPSKPMTAVKTLSIKRNDKKEFILNWSKTDDNLKFYYSTKQPDFEIGKIVSVNQLKADMKALNVLYNEKEKLATFNYNGEYDIFITAVAEKDDIAVMGATVKASNIGKVIIEKISERNDMLAINIRPVKNATGYLVLYRFDKFPTSIDDKESYRKSFSLNRLGRHNNLFIEGNSEQRYYISVFAQKANSLSVEYSEASNISYKISNPIEVIYSFEIGKKIFMQKDIVMIFESEEFDYILPDIDIVYDNDNFPMKKENAFLLAQINRQRIVGEQKFIIDIPRGVKKGAYVRPFVRRNEDEDKIIFTLKANNYSQVI